LTDTKALEAEVDYWKHRYESERERLAKLWVAYKSLESEANAADAAKAADATASKK
jgi:hypothetical protein